MSNQQLEMHKPDFFQDSVMEGLDPMNRLAFLHLTNTTNTAAATNKSDSPSTTAISDSHCTTCGNTMKRRSPSSSSILKDPTSTTTTTFDSEPKPKKPTLQENHHQPLPGFTKLDLPISFPSPYPFLRRCSSDPYNSPGTENNTGNTSTQPGYTFGSETSAFLNSHSPENSGLGVNGNTPSPARGNSSMASLPPLPPVLRRSVSDPTPSMTPVAKPPTATGGAYSRSSSAGEMGSGLQLPVDLIKEESPDTKRLRRMKDRMREMSQWWDDVMREGEDVASEDNNSNGARQDAFGAEAEEQVTVERLGECLCVNFRCPCSKGYQILLSGSCCYYKLL